MSARRVDRERLGGEPVLLPCNHGAAGMAGAQATHCSQHDNEHEEAKEIHAPVRVEGDAAKDAQLRQLVGGLKPGEVERTQEVLRRGHGESKRRDGEKRAADAQRWDADDEGRQARCRRAGGHGEEHVKPMGDEHAGYGAAEPHEPDLTKRDVAREPGQHDQRATDYRVDDDERRQLRARRRQEVWQRDRGGEQDQHQGGAAGLHSTQVDKLGRDGPHRAYRLPCRDGRIGCT